MNVPIINNLVLNFLFVFIVCNMQHNEGYQIGKNCNSILGIYDPFHARNNCTSNAEYRMFCNSSSPQRCELGDLSGKLGQINIGRKLIMYCH